MEFLKKLYCEVIDKAFGDPPGTSKIKITEDKCSLCGTVCHKKCECRCHVPSCRKCDDKNCNYKKCQCKCHYVPEKEVIRREEPKPEPKGEIKPEPAVEIKPEPVIVEIPKAESSIFNEFSGAEQLPEKVKSGLPSITNDFMSQFFAENNNQDEEITLKSHIPRSAPSKPEKISKLKNFVSNNMMNNSNANANVNVNNSQATSGPLIKFKSKLNKVNKLQSVVNDLKSRVKEKEISPLSNSISKSPTKNNLNSSYHSNNSKNTSQNKNNESFNILKNPLTFSTIKKRVENMKFKNLQINKKSQNDFNDGGYTSNLNITADDIQNSPNMSITASPIPPSMSPNKMHLNYSFDLNNSRLYHGKSSVVMRMEDLQRQIVHEKTKSKDYQVDNLVKGFEKQEAWQMYNSILFADPTNLPDAGALKKPNEKIKIFSDKTKQKLGAITSTANRKNNK